MLYRAVVRDGDRNQVFIVDDDEAAGLVLADYAELALPDWKATVIDNGYDAILQIYRSSSSPTLPTNACRLLSVPRSDGGCRKPTPAAISHRPPAA